MDLMDELERNKDMEVVRLDCGLEIEIPEEMIDERMNVFYMDRMKAVEDIKTMANAFCASFSTQEITSLITSSYFLHFFSYIDRVQSRKGVILW